MVDLNKYISEHYDNKAKGREILEPPTNECVENYLKTIVLPVFTKIEHALSAHLTSVRVYPSLKQKKVRIKFKDDDMKCEFGIKIENSKRSKNVRFTNQPCRHLAPQKTIGYTELSDISADFIEEQFLEYFSDREACIDERTSNEKRDKEYHYELAMAFDCDDPFEYASGAPQLREDLSSEQKQIVDAIHTRYFGVGYFSNTGVCGACGQKII